MVLIPAGKFDFKVTGVEIEKSEGVDVQYPWEDKPGLKHDHEMSIKAFYIDTDARDVRRVQTVPGGDPLPPQG